MNQNLSYYSPSLNKSWISYWALRPDFPNVSLPQYVDIPELDIYLVYYPEPIPEIPEGMTLEWLETPELNIEDNKYYRAYKLIPIEG